MNYEWFVVISLAKITAAFVLFFVYLPAKIFPQRQDAPPIERFFENFVLMASSAIIFIHILALLQVYSIVALLLCYVLLYGGMFWYREKAFPIKKLKTFWVEKVVLTLDILDQVVNLKARARERLKKKWKGWGEQAKNRLALVHAFLFGAILFYSAAIRYYDVFRSPAFGYSDPYTHLLWMKQLESGLLFPPGPPRHNPYYPKGFHAFLAVLHGLTSLDGASVVRLAGPLVGVLLVLSVYYTGRKLTKSGEAALVGMFVFGTFIQIIPLLDVYFLQDGRIEYLTGPSSLGGWFSRQTTTLPEEFALVFLMPALLWAYAYVAETNRKRDLALFFFSLITVFTVHSLVAAGLGGGFLLLIILSLLFRPSIWRSLIVLSLAAFFASLVGNATLIYGFFAGPQMQGSSSFYGEWLAFWENKGPIPYSLEILLSAAVAASLIASGLIFIRGRSGKLLWSFMGLYLGVLTFGGRSINFGVKYLLPLDRIGHFRVLVLCGAIAGLYHILTFAPFLKWSRRRFAYQTLTFASLVVLGIVGLPSEIPAPPRYEYGTFARIVGEIRRTFPPLEWTVVSTVEDYSKILRDRGWHLNAQDFLKQYNPYQRDLDIPTPYIFLFVEKKPFGFSSNPQFSRDLRQDLERRLSEWANLYSIGHNDIAVYYEDWDVLVYLITREERLMRKPPPSDGGRRIVSQVLYKLWKR